MPSGLSPRVRGNRSGPTAAPRRPRSIPACAGEPPGERQTSRPASVYPRVCGGTAPPAVMGAVWLGLSPRVRGNLGGISDRARLLRSIPACAGEPLLIPASGRAMSVYPRVCGGTPYRRGGWCERGVYPRVCGGTEAFVERGQSFVGLSPRVRGNPSPGESRCPKVRSIPACAGEPAGPPMPGPAVKVYPRVCGGTACPIRRLMTPAGLSPRVRGNLGVAALPAEHSGSIPACAGEPSWYPSRSSGSRVYPRVCGGTAAPTRTPGSKWGLSPRVRGNLLRSMAGLMIGRSIPACAGEPNRPLVMRQWRKVYPRVCGGTAAAHSPGSRRWGLSPRVRGNPSARSTRTHWSGSIPACAGEPG